MKSFLGNSYGTLLVIGEGYREKTKRYVLTKCKLCGSESNKIIYNIINSNGGCKCNSNIRIGIANTKLGLSSTYFYNRFARILQRCNNPKDPGYKNYGGRGIKCEWNSFEEFYKDMYDSYLYHSDLFGNDNTFIERKNNDGNYCKNNCRWATAKEQNRNTRFNNNITFNGKTQCISDWAKELGIKRSTLTERIRRHGWSIEKALTTP